MTLVYTLLFALLFFSGNLFAEKVHRLSISHREGGGIGYSKGYTSLDAFFSIPTEKCTPFFDCRAHIFDDGRWAANAGVGVRKLFCEDWIVGANAFYDYRHLYHTTFNQIGFGLELLGIKWDLHGNAYIPIGRNRRNYANPFSGFSGGFAYFNRKYEYVFAGADLLVGREFWSCGEYGLRGAIGSYFLKGHFNKKALGGLLKLKAEISPYVHIEGQLSYDHIFKWRPQGELRLNLPIGKRVCIKRSCLSHQIVQPVDRFEIIPTSHKKKRVAAVSTTTGATLNFIFVNNQSSTFSVLLNSFALGQSNPSYSNLADAVAASKSGDVLYVSKGDGTSKGMDSGVFLKDRQQLIADSTPLVVKLPGGPQVTIPAQSTGAPTMSNIGGAVITLANDNVIQGFNLTSASIGISGNGIQGTTISNVQFSNIATKSISLQNISGTVAVSKNTDHGSKGVSLTTDSKDSSTISITDSSWTSTTIDTNLIDVTLNNPSNLIIDNNTVSGGSIGANYGIIYTVNNTATVLISNNTVSQANIGIFGALSPTTLATVTVLSNSTSQTKNEGISSITFSGYANLDVRNNTVTTPNLMSLNNIGITLLNENLTSLRLSGNSSAPNNGNVYGYELRNLSGTFSVQSPDLAFDGLQNLNTYPILPESIVYIPYVNP